MSKIVSLEETLKAGDPERRFPFHIFEKVAYIANDSPSGTPGTLKINIDGQINENNTFTLYSGEVVSDLNTTAENINVQAIGNDVPFRIVGV